MTENGKERRNSNLSITSPALREGRRGRERDRDRDRRERERERERTCKK